MKYLTMTFACFTLILMFTLIALRSEYSVYMDTTIEADTKLRNAHNLELEKKDKEIENLKTMLEENKEAFQIAMTENRLVSTLANKDMNKWTVQDVLTARKKFSLIPYGSPFAGGHIITAEFGSHMLDKGYWGSDGHNGVDLIPKSGNSREPVLAVIDGRVVTWGRDDGYLR